VAFSVGDKFFAATFRLLCLSGPTISAQLLPFVQFSVACRAFGKGDSCVSPGFFLVHARPTVTVAFFGESLPTLNAVSCFLFSPNILPLFGIPARPACPVFDLKKNFVAAYSAFFAEVDDL
jgi:hypothetical protein